MVRVSGAGDRPCHRLPAVRTEGEQLPGRDNGRRDRGGCRMIAKAKSISHGIRAMLYVSGETRKKKNPEKKNRFGYNDIIQSIDSSVNLTEQ